MILGRFHFCNNILITYKLSHFDHVLGVVSQTRVSGGKRFYGPHAYTGIFLLLFSIFRWWTPTIYDQRHHHIVNAFRIISFLWKSTYIWFPSKPRKLILCSQTTTFYLICYDVAVAWQTLLCLVYSVTSFWELPV